MPYLRHDSHSALTVGGGGGGADLAEGAQPGCREADGKVWAPFANARGPLPFGNVSQTAAPVARTAREAEALPKRGNMSDSLPPNPARGFPG